MLRQTIARLDSEGRHRLMAVLLHDLTIEVRSIVSNEPTSSSMASLVRINEIEHQIAGFFISGGDQQRYSADRIESILNDCRDYRLINWHRFYRRAFAPEAFC